MKIINNLEFLNLFFPKNNLTSNNNKIFLFSGNIGKENLIKIILFEINICLEKLN